ncbi:helix-turn-helix domain-containing protein [Dietzia maris]|uniref:helix-turn-helix domain-containing protein n=1 Tax=Dietzia maris TaxID=37915 RepID=UPI00344C207E
MSTMPTMGLPAAAEYLGVSDKFIRRQVSDGRLPAYRLGGPRGRLRFYREDLDALLTPVPTASRQGGGRA